MPRTQQRTAAELIPDGASLDELADIAAGCTACDLYKLGTQTVFGEGKKTSQVMLVGEQPGDKEDIEGRPFVGPAGRLLDSALDAAGIDRRKVYVTNVVKHFKWEARGKRRIHKKPNASEVRACKPWLEAEIGRVKPRMVVALGATAAQALLGSSFRVTQHRGELAEWELEPMITATVHPSSILRAPDEDARAREMEAFIKDLRFVQKALG
jgi:uracil-DNA glycosylase